MNNIDYSHYIRELNLLLYYITDNQLYNKIIIK